MWPFGRKQETAQRAEPATDPPQVHFDWKRVPVIQRTVGVHPLTVQTSRFASELATHNDPRALAKPLGHRVSLEAPAGLVLDFVRPQTRSEGPELVTRQRSHRSPIQRVASDAAFPEAEWHETETPTETAAVPPRPPRQLPIAVEARPAVQLMHVTPETEPRPLPSGREIAVASPSPVQAPAAVQAVAESAGDLVTEVPAYPRLTLGQARRLGLGAPISHVPGTATSVQRARETPARLPVKTPDAALSVNAPEPPTPAEAAPQFQPFALDYLITKKAPPVAPTLISQRQRMQPPLPVSRSPEAAQSGAEALPVPSSQAAAPDADPGVSPADADTPAQRFQEAATASQAAEQRMPGEPPSIAEPASSAERATTAELAAAATGETGEGRAQSAHALPLAAGAGRHTVQRAEGIEEAELAPTEDTSSGGNSLQRSAELSALGQDDITKSGNEPIAPLLGERASIATLASPAGAIREATSEPALPRAAGVKGRASAPTPSGPSVADNLRASPAAAPMYPAVQRMAEAAGATRTIAGGPMALRSERTPIGVLEHPSRLPEPLGGREETARPLPVPYRGTVIQRVEDKDDHLPLALPQAYGQSAPVIQRASFSEPGPSVEHAISTESSTPFGGYWSASTVGIPVQRASSQDWTIQAEAEAPSSSSAVAPPSAPAPGTAADEHGQIDDLATKLYDKIRTKLRSELLVDRERAGLLTDLR